MKRTLRPNLIHLFASLKQILQPNFLAFLAGLGLFAAGAYQVYPPAGLIGPGLILMAVSVFGDRQVKP